MDSNGEDMENSLNELEKKMTSFSSILEKFGLDIITKMGQTNLKITQLTDMVEELHKSTIKIKGLTPQLTNVIENQKDIEDELNLIKSLIMNLTSLPLKRSEPSSGCMNPATIRRVVVFPDPLPAFRSFGRPLRWSPDSF